MAEEPGAPTVGHPQGPQAVPAARRPTAGVAR